MATLINLRSARKAKSRDTARKQANANAVKFGRTKAEKDLTNAKTEKEERDLDRHQRE